MALAWLAWGCNLGTPPQTSPSQTPPSPIPPAATAQDSTAGLAWLNQPLPEQWDRNNPKSEFFELKGFSPDDLSPAPMETPPAPVDPVACVNLYYQLCDQGLFEEAYGLRSSKLQHTKPVKQWVGLMVNNQGVTVIESHLAEPGVVEVVVESRDRDPRTGKIIVGRYPSRIQLTQEEGSWKLDAFTPLAQEAHQP